MNFFIILCNFVLIFSTHVFCLNIENQVSNKSKLNFNNKNIDEYIYDYSEYNDNDEDIAENINENIISKHFSAITLRNTSIDESLDLLNLIVKNISVYDRFKNIYKHMSENLNPVKIMIKQKFNEFIHSLELPNDCLASFARIINAMEKSELWAFECEFHYCESYKYIFGIF
jgi:hypothetical protein